MTEGTLGLSRSEMMSRIRGRDTGPERMFARALWAAGVRYRLYGLTPVGRPDFTMASKRVAVFVDGCQWHGCPRHYVRPRSNVRFWSKKLRMNFERDLRQTQALEQGGWRVIRVWEHDIRLDANAAAAVVVAAICDSPYVSPPDVRVVRVEVVDETRDLERRYSRDVRTGRAARPSTRIRSTSKLQ